MFLLKYERNPYEGAEIDPLSLPDQKDDFTIMLKETLTQLRSEGIKVVWMNLPLEKAALIPVAVEAGFSYHHADSEGLEMTLILKEGSYIPPYATHYIGAGGVVLDDHRNLLVISEKYNIRKKPHLKLPGGTLEPGEHISEAVCREVLEETGIKTEFRHLACLRHWHNYRYGKSDIYFVCRLKPLNKDIIMDTEEISRTLWMPVDEFLSSPEIHPFNKRIVRSGLKENGVTRDFIEGYGTPETHEMLFT